MPLSPQPRYSRRLELKAFRRRDAEPLYEAVACSLSELHEWLPWAQLDYSKADAARFIRESQVSWKSGQAYDFALALRQVPDRHVGNVSLWFVSKAYRIGEIGYWIRTDATGSGLATEAAARLLPVAFEELNMHRVILRIAVGNRPSERVAQKLGFVREGLLREEIKVKGSWLDHSVWGLLAGEYRKGADRYRAWAEATTSPH